MRYLVSEGKNDAYFLESFIKKELSDKTLSITDDINKASELFYSPDFFLKHNYIIYGDNGRPTVYDKVIPRIVFNGFGVIRHIFKFYLILDKDYNNEPEKIQKIKILECIKIQLIKKQFKRIEPIEINNECLSVVSQRNSGYRMDIEVIFIPKSLERQVHLKFLEKFPKKAKDWKIASSESKDPHDILRDLATSTLSCH